MGITTTDKGVIGMAFKIFHEELGSGYADVASYPADDGKMIVAGIRGVFAPKLTNRTAVDVFVRVKGQSIPISEPVYSAETIHKGDCIALDKQGRELIIFAGTHATGEPPDPNNKRRIFLEKDSFVLFDE